MVIPIPASAMMDDAPPSPFGLKMRPYCIILVAIQFGIVFGRLILLDLMGMIAMLIPAGIGAVMIKEGLPMRWVQMWGLFNFINAIFDTLMALVKVPNTVMAIKAGHIMDGDKEVKIEPETMGLLWLILITVILAPITEMFCAYIGYQMYKEREDDRSSLFHEQYGQGGGFGQFGADGSRAGGQNFAQPTYGTTGSDGRIVQQQGFVPFGGQGRTLGGSD